LVAFAQAGGNLFDGLPSDGQSVAIRPKYLGGQRLIQIAIATLASERALLLVGEPGTAKSGSANTQACSGALSLSEKEIAIPKLNQVVLAQRGFNLIATANTRPGRGDRPTGSA
jgi:MoxR-like ATPase